MKAVTCWINVIILLVLILILLYTEKKYAPFRKILMPLIRWSEYRLNIVMVTTIILATSIMITITLGFFLYWSKTVPDVGTVFWNQVKNGTIFETICQALKSGRFGEGVLFGIRIVFDLLEGEYEELYAGFPNSSSLIRCLSILIPTMTVGTVIIALLKAFPVFFLPRKEYLIFAQTEENSICLAESMMYKDHNRKVRKGRKAIFLRTERDSLSPEYASRIRKIKARMYPYTEADFLRIHWGLRRKRLRFFFLSANTDVNFSRMKTFMEEVEADKLFLKPLDFNGKRRKEYENNGYFQQELYLLSETESAPLLIDHLRRDMCQKRENNKAKYERKPVFQHTDIRLLDRYRTVMYELLQQKPLYECTDQKEIRVLVLGLGKVGKAFFRAAVSFSAMAGYETSFHIRDMEIDKQWHDLLLQYPQCDEDIQVDKKSMNVESEELLTLLDNAACNGKPFTYIVLSLGDDERNIKVASRMARYYRQQFWEKPSTLLPLICVNLEDKIKSDYVADFYKDLQPERPLHVFGSDNDTFSEGMLINRNLWAIARRLHSNLKGNDFAFWNEYERRSSVACAAHASYHSKAMETFSMVKTHDQSFESLKGDQKEKMVDAEHRRWMNYSRCEGMQFIAPQTAKRILEEMGTHVDTNARLTPCLVPTKDLDDLYKQLYPHAKETNRQLEQEGKTPHRTFYERDRFVVKNIYRIQGYLPNQSCDYRFDELKDEPVVENVNV